MSPTDFQPPPTGVTAADYVTEQRLQKLEEVTVQFAAHTAAEEYRFEMISNQIKDLDERLEKNLTELREAVSTISVRQGKTSDAVDILLGERQKRNERKARWTKYVVAAFVAVGGGLLGKFGEQVWSWITK